MLSKHLCVRTLRTSTSVCRRLFKPAHLQLDLRPLVTAQSSPKRTMATAAMGKRLEGKTIVITGASSGIGRSTALEFARTAPKNLKLILTARRVDKLKELAQEINQEVGHGVKVHAVKLDVGNPSEVKGFVSSLPAEYQDIDVLVNNAYAFLHMSRWHQSHFFRTGN